ncbi:MAG: hopanoid-associated sugar epimerase [Thermodesulfobacteriota bacterium]
MTQVMLTGATGFVGGNLLALLMERGFRVRCLVRGGKLPPLAPDPWDVEVCQGDLRDFESVESCAAGCEVIFHVAADYRLWVPDPHIMFAINVEGTRNVLRAAAKVAVRRVIHTSTVGTLGIPRDGSPGTEETPVGLQDMVSPYKRSKFLAEQEALRAAAEGLDVVVVNPSTPVGAGDVKPTPTGRIITDFLNRRMPAYVDTGLNLVHVKDVALGHILAMERGRSGEKYILGNENLTLREILGLLARICGIPAPRVRLPKVPILALAYLNEAVSRWVTHKEPRIPLDGVRMAAKRMFFDASKAVRELGMPQTPVRQALEEAVQWFRDNGYVGRQVA